MKNQNIFLLLLLVTSYSAPVSAMRRTAGITQQLLRPQTSTRLMQHNTPTKLSAVLFSARSMSTAPRIPHANWLNNASYKQLKAEPTSPKTQSMLEELKEQESEDPDQSNESTVQILLRVAARDTSIAPIAYVTLLAAGADINGADAEGQTPLHLLAQNSNTLYDESYLMPLFALLAKYKPNFQVRDQHGKTPTDYAPENFKQLFKTHEPLDRDKIRYMYRHTGK